MSIVVMLDHLHLLVKLIETPLSESVRQLKGPLTHDLWKKDLTWEKSFYDHRLRPDEKVAGIIRYMWLNPYCAGLINEAERWPGWWCDPQIEKWVGLQDSPTPPPEWWR